VRRPIRSLSGVTIAVAIAVVVGGCGGADEGPKAPPTTPSPAAKSPPPEAPVRDMKPAEPKPDEPKTAAKGISDAKPSDEPPPLVPPAGAKDERPDAAKPK
jgi:hypothetical protein